jgi:hypothetical protein
MIRVEYKVIPNTADSITFRVEIINFDVLLINKQGLYYLFHPAQILNTLNTPDWRRKEVGSNELMRFSLCDATQIPADIARIFTGE